MISRAISSLIYETHRAVGVWERNLRILSYHRVNEDIREYTCISPENFNEQMDYLARTGYTTLRLEDFMAHLDRPRDSNWHLIGGHPLNTPRPITLTFDDGFEDIYRYAYPVMKRHGFFGTVFCVAEKVGEKDYLNQAQIEEMSRDGFEFGSHTLTHANLKNAGRDEKWREIVESKAVLEEMLRRPVNFFCYPYGEYDKEAVEFVAMAGYRGACSNRPGSNPMERAGNKRDGDPFLLRRTEIGAKDTLKDFKKKLVGAYDWLHAVLHALRGRP